MPRITVRQADLPSIVHWRESYRAEMDCQIIHDSIHTRPGWTREYIVSVDGVPAGYGSVAIAGPWKTSHALYEIYFEPAHRVHAFALTGALLRKARPQIIETQTNDRWLTVMAHTYCRDVHAEAILFEDGCTTRHHPRGAAFRVAEPADRPVLETLQLDQDARYVITWNGKLAGAGGILFHYNRPYGDIYMAVAEPYRRRGLGAFLVQELKAVCRAGGSTPAARCNVINEPSRRTLQKAGFLPCGNIIAGELLR